MAFHPEICAELRRLCFVRTYHTRGGGSRMAEYNLVMPDRVLCAQVWDDHCHRISLSVRGCSDTYPTSFSTVEELHKALLHESTRCDSGFQDPAHWRRVYPSNHGIFY